MTDSPIGSDAWTVDPATYLAGRVPTHSVPARPRSLYLGMRDGVRLAADIHLPAGPRPPRGFPAVLVFTPYYRRGNVSRVFPLLAQNDLFFRIENHARIFGERPSSFALITRFI